MHARCVRAVATLIIRAKHVLGSRRYWHSLESRHCGISTVYLSNVWEFTDGRAPQSGPVGRPLAEVGAALSPAISAVSWPSLEPRHVDVGGVPHGVTVRRRRLRVKRAAPKFRSTPLVPPFAPTMISTDSSPEGCGAATRTSVHDSAHRTSRRLVYTLIPTPCEGGPNALIDRYLGPLKPRTFFGLRSLARSDDRLEDLSTPYVGRGGRPIRSTATRGCRPRRRYWSRRRTGASCLPGG